MDLTQTLLANLILLSGIMVSLWLLSLVRKDASLVDPFWGTGFALTAGLSWALNGPSSARLELVVCLVCVWGLRLSLFLLWRNWGQEEDSRYRAMRRRHGRRFGWVSLFSVFLLQGAILWFVALPVQVLAAVDSPAPLGWLDAAGCLLWGLGLFFEAVGDWQLARFKADPGSSGRVLDRGLWRYTRHPNYFGDFCVWWGIYLLAASGGGAWTLASPLLMSLLLLKVSGVTLLERTITDRRPAYADYQRRTNAFFPGPPRSAR